MIFIKLKRVPNKKQLIFHIVVESKISSNNRFIEKIGYYKPISDF
jgi:ribosomal protein S16